MSHTGFQYRHQTVTSYTTHQISCFYLQLRNFVKKQYNSFPNKLPSTSINALVSLFADKDVIC